MNQLFVRQIRSSIRSKEQHVRTLKALGLGKVGKTRVLPDQPSVRGMIRSVIQWVEVKDVKA
jgi:large subunit ribosomal protein L30